MTACFHCGEKISDGCNLITKIDGVDQAMCCIGCQAVAQFLTDNEHEVFYQYRDNKLPGVQASIKTKQWHYLDNVDVFNALVQPIDSHCSQITIKVEGMYCSACGWLIQKVLLNLPGVIDLQINAVTQNLRVTFNPETIKLSQLFSQISALGYHPLQLQNLNQDIDNERKNQLKKIAVAGFGMMFVMTLAVPLYSPELFEVEPHIQRFFLMISLLIATGVFFYSGQDFVNNAIRDIRNKHLGMDVPVALSISLAYFVSLYLSFKQQGHVYFDSMTMFIFFLLLGRFVESQIRHKGMNVRESLFALVPVSTERIIGNGVVETIPLSQVEKGQQLRVRTGQVIPCDGQITTGGGEVNEAILTGESKLISKQRGDLIYAGSQLTTGELVFVTTVNNQDSFLAKLADLMETAQSKKPPSLQLVDQIASYFVGIVLLLATVTALWYGFSQREGMMTALLSVLIATCPCALSLATPTALTAAGINLLNKGILVNNTEAITQLAKIDHWYFDKTGTLSEDKLTVNKQQQFTDSSELKSITASLQQISNHPIASAFHHHELKSVSHAQEHSGLGVSGTINQQQWYMGSLSWMESLGVKIPATQIDTSLSQVYLACEHQLIALFELAVPIRAGAKELLSTLNTQGKSQTILSGDKSATVKNWAQMLNISNYCGDLSAEDKINLITKQQQSGQRCVMVGDGVNDAPVLSQSDVSISLKQGAYLAHSASDMIVLGRSFAPVVQAIMVSAKSNAIIKQNLSWSLVYNLSVTPIAMMGLLAPWMAAIGMSLSSLLVVLNSRRLL